MSNEAPIWFQEQWARNVIHAYQSRGYLTKGMTTPPVRVEGKKMHFPIAGKGVAQDYTRGDKVKVMNATRGEVLLDAKEWDAADYCYTWDLERMAASEMDATTETASMALGRKHDEVLFDLFRGLALPANQVVGAYADAALPGPTKILQARRELVKADVPTEDGRIYCGLPPLVFDDMMRYQVFANSQWVGGDMPFAKNTRMKTWQQVHFFELPEFLHTRPAANQGRFWMWHASTVGSGYTGQPLKTEWQWQLEYKRWYYQSTLAAGVCIIQQPGIMEFRYNDSLIPTFT